MHFSEPASDLTAALALAAGANAWAQKADGRGGQQPFLYIQQESLRVIVRTDLLSNTFKVTDQVHEACTYCNTNNVHTDGDFCAYWIDGNGNIFRGSKYDFCVLTNVRSSTGLTIYGQAVDIRPLASRLVS